MLLCPDHHTLSEKITVELTRNWNFGSLSCCQHWKCVFCFIFFFLRAILFLPGQILAIRLFGKPKENLTLATHRVLATAMDCISRMVGNKLFLHPSLSTVVLLVSSKVLETHGIVTDLVGIWIWHLKRPCIVSVTVQWTDLGFTSSFKFIWIDKSAVLICICSILSQRFLGADGGFIKMGSCPLFLHLCFHS